MGPLSSSRMRLQRVLLQNEFFCSMVNSLSTRLQSSVPKEEPQTFRFADISVRLASPERLQPKPEVKALQFGKHFTDHMLKIEYHVRAGGWQQPVICPLEYLSLHPAAKVLHYSVELFEGMKAYRGQDGKIRIFRPELNMMRMNLGAMSSGLPTFDSEELIKCISRLISIDSEWVPHSEAASLYIRPTLIGTEPTLGVSEPESALLYVILCPVGPYFGQQTVRSITLLADPKFVRAWPGGVGDKKLGSNYGPTISIGKNAAKKGFNQVLWLYGENHEITEAGTMNIFAVYINDHGEKELITAPLNGLILPGITRLTILQLAREWNQFSVAERVMTMPELKKLNGEGRLLEVFGAGTACVVSPVSSIHYMGEDIRIPTLDQPEPLCDKFLRTLLDIQYGYVEHPWARPID